jgi:hypothetical protein
VAALAAVPGGVRVGVDAVLVVYVALAAPAAAGGRRAAAVAPPGSQVSLRLALKAGGAEAGLAAALPPVAAWLAEKWPALPGGLPAAAAGVAVAPGGVAPVDKLPPVVPVDGGLASASPSAAPPPPPAPPAAVVGGMPLYQTALVAAAAAFGGLLCALGAGAACCARRAAGDGAPPKGPPAPAPAGRLTRRRCPWPDGRAAPRLPLRPAAAAGAGRRLAAGRPGRLGVAPVGLAAAAAAGHHAALALGASAAAAASRRHHSSSRRAGREGPADVSRLSRRFAPPPTTAASVDGGGSAMADTASVARRARRKGRHRPGVGRPRVGP